MRWLIIKDNKKKSFVYSATIRKNVRELNNPGESKICKVGKHKVLLTRSNKLDSYGNPVHTAAYINKDGTTGVSYRTNGSAAYAVIRMLKKKNIDVKHGGKWLWNNI